MGVGATPKVIEALTDSIFNGPQVAGRVLTASELAENFVVLGIQPVALQWLLDANGIYLGKTYQFIGETASCKSQFLYEIGKMFLEAGGLFCLVETENKTSPLTLKAKLGEELYNSGRFFFHQVDLHDADPDSKAEPWQRAVSNFVEKITKAGAAGIPTWIGVDSLVGSGSAESNKQISADGAAEGRSTSGLVRASSNTKYIQKISKDLVDTGMTLAITNHLKSSVSEMGGGRPSYIPDKGGYGGGDAVGFQCATMLDFRRADAQDGVNEAGRYISISMRKGSFGKDFQRIRVPFDVGMKKDADGNLIKDEKGFPIRTITWDWDEALALLLYSFCVKDKSSYYYTAAASKILPMERKGGLYGSKRLGVEGLSATEFGALVRQSKDVIRDLMELPRFNINQYRVAAGYVDE